MAAARRAQQPLKGAKDAQDPVALRKEALEAQRAAMVEEQLRKHQSNGSAKATSPPGTDPYDCEEDLDEWEVTWKTGKKDWCCRHQQVGCEAHDKESVPSWGGSRTEW